MMERITAIGSCEDDVERRSLLATLSTDLEADFDERDGLRTANENYAADNERLRAANMDLFLQIGSKGKGDGAPPPDPEPVQKMSFASLFNEKGELK
jgi:hypothetical protein